MGLEAATFVSDLVSTNPVGAADQVQQGDDHIRMLKAVLQTCFPNASKAFRFPATAAQNVNFSAVSADQNKTFVVTTTAGAITATLPALAASDAGWEAFFIKITTDSNPLFIAPVAGTIQSGEYAGLVKTRRCIPGRRTRVLWTGTAWLAERVECNPVGTVLDSWLSSTPVGYEPANGTSLSSALNYPEYNSAKGGLSVPDCTGRAVAGKEAVATRLTPLISGIDGAALGATGGVQSTSLIQPNIPNYNLSIAGLTGSVSTSVNVNNGSNVWNGGGDGANVVAGGGATPRNASQANVSASLNSGTVTFGGSIPSGGTGTAFAIAQPTIVLNKIIVVE